ncbi:MAG TPA: VTT domain-containing protein [Oscillospiraceae bacterium]|nr:VTT domain-containing protein [Oscillospiraceae bacterium]
MFLESIGIPFASAFVALTAGTIISAGKASFLEVLLITTTGLTLGSIVSYFIGYWGSSVGRLLLKDRKKNAEKSRFLEHYRRWGEVSILFAQLFGTTRTWASIPAGAMKMKLQRFILYTAIGGTIYCTAAIGFSFVVTKLLAMLQLQYLALVLLSLVIVLAGVIFFRLRDHQETHTKKEPKTPAK